MIITLYQQAKAQLILGVGVLNSNLLLKKNLLVELIGIHNFISIWIQ